MKVTDSGLHVPDMPDWLRTINPKCRLSSREVMGLFNFVCHSTITEGVQKGRFPPPDVTLGGRMMWKPETIRRELRRRQELIKKEEKQNNEN